MAAHLPMGSHMRSEIECAKTSPSMGGRVTRGMRFGLAAAGVVLIAGVSVGLAMVGSTDKTQASKLSIRRAVAVGAPVAQSSSRPQSSPVTSVQTALPGLTRPLRDMVNVPAGKHTELPELSKAEALGGVTSSGRTVDVQTKPGSGQMPSPIQNFDGIARICGCLPPDTEGDVGPNHYMQWV